jgi:hypothetical protein
MFFTVGVRSARWNTDLQEEGVLTEEGKLRLTEKLKAGDRVRVKPGAWYQYFQTGEKGKILFGSKDVPGGQFYVKVKGQKGRTAWMQSVDLEKIPSRTSELWKRVYSRYETLKYCLWWNLQTSRYFLFLAWKALRGKIITIQRDVTESKGGYKYLSITISKRPVSGEHTYEDLGYQPRENKS